MLISYNFFFLYSFILKINLTCNLLKSYSFFDFLFIYFISHFILSAMIEEFKTRLGEFISFQTLLLDYINQNFDDENNDQYNQLIEFINKNNIRSNKSKIIQLLHILSQLAGSHFRGHDLLRKIDRILQELINDINTLITNLSELFNIFKYNKTILLFLLKNIEQLDNNPKNKEIFLLHILESEDKELIQYFYPELRELATLEQNSDISDSEFNFSKFKDDYNNKIKEFKLKNFINENDQNIELFNIRRNQGENETKCLTQGWNYQC